MASIVKRERKNKEPAWQVQIRLPNCKSVMKTFDTEEQAMQFAELAEPKIRRAALTSELKNEALFHKEAFKSAVKAFVASPRCSPLQKKLANTILAHIDNTPTGKVRKRFVRAYAERMLVTKSKMNRVFKPSTIAAHLCLMGVIYRWRAEYLDVDCPRSPFTLDVLPRGWERGRSRRLEGGEERALYDAAATSRTDARTHWPLLIGLAIETGARQQELARATWAQIDLRDRLWRIPATNTKTATKRTVGLSRRAVEIINKLDQLSDKDSPLIFHCFPSTAAICYGFRKIAERAGVVDFHFHDLRHEAISRMAANHRKLPPSLIMKMAGHKSYEMLDRYFNVKDDELIGILE